jgi:hypothetical protein
MNSAIPGDPESAGVNITVATIQPGYDFLLCLAQVEHHYAYIRFTSTPRAGDEVYRVSAMETQDLETQDNEGWIPLNTWLSRRVRALTESFEVCYLTCLETHILLTHSLVFRAPTHRRVHSTQASFRFCLLAWLRRHDDVRFRTEHILQISCMPPSPPPPREELFQGVSPSCP